MDLGQWLARTYSADVDVDECVKCAIIGDNLGVKVYYAMMTAAQRQELKRVLKEWFPKIIIRKGL